MKIDSSSRMVSPPSPRIIPFGIYRCQKGTIYESNLYQNAAAMTTSISTAFPSPFLHPEKTSIALSDRHFRRGRGRIILVCHRRSPMRRCGSSIWTASGEDVGNGIRCVGKFLYDHGICRKPEMDIDTLSGVKHLTLHFEGSEAASVTVDMGSAILSPEQIPVRLEGDCVIGREVEVAGTHHTITCVSMGNPHCVLFGDDPDLLYLSKSGSILKKPPIPRERQYRVCSVTWTATRSKCGFGNAAAAKPGRGTGASAAAVAVEKWILSKK